MESMKRSGGRRSDRKYQEEEVTPDRLRDLLGDITYHWHSDQKAMSKTRNTLLKLIGEFARRTVRELKNMKGPRKSREQRLQQ
jgi:hypothetical protein